MFEQLLKDTGEALLMIAIGVGLTIGLIALVTVPLAMISRRFIERKKR